MERVCASPKIGKGPNTSNTGLGLRFPSRTTTSLPLRILAIFRSHFHPELSSHVNRDMDTEFSSFQQESWIKFDNESESSAQPKLDAESKDGERSKSEYDLVNFLAVVQAMKIPILPIKWQATVKTIGRGGSGSIWEAPISAKTSLAFKRVSDLLKMEVKSASDEQERRRLKASIFQTLINEVIVLSHPKLRRHPNILELQGMCWDVEEDEVWPVLVFEKAKFGDLERFLTSPASKALTADERLSLCIDVGRALIDMDSYGKDDNIIPLASSS